MTVNTYDIADLVTLTGTFKNASGVLTDATAVTCTVRDPAGNTTTPAVTHASTGVYTAQVDLTNAVAGMWWYSFLGTGTAQANEWQQFFVEAPRT